VVVAEAKPFFSGKKNQKTFASLARRLTTQAPRR
jgi:hypothetical protein